MCSGGGGSGGGGNGGGGLVGVLVVVHRVCGVCVDVMKSGQPKLFA